MRRLGGYGSRYACGRCHRRAQQQRHRHRLDCGRYGGCAGCEGQAEGSYVYVELSYRDGNTFTIYQNLDSFGPRRITGSYSLYTDDALGAVIRGMYDYENGDWASRYVIRDLYEDRMTWIAVGDETNVSEYVRCEAIPEEILSQFGAAEEE